MDKLLHILALLSLLAMGKGEPELVITKTVGSSIYPITSTVGVATGLNFTLNCKIIDSENQTFIDDEVVWSRKTNNSRFQGIIDRVEPSKLTFSPITLQDGGIYICTSAAHNRSKSVHIHPEWSIPDIQKLKKWDIDIPPFNFSLPEDFFDKNFPKIEIRSPSRPFHYIVPVIAILVGIVRLCVYMSRTTDRDGGNVENGSGPNDSQNAGNDLPPSYNEALANMAADAAANAVGSSSAAKDVLPSSHTGSIQQRV